jgi:hypothetical protein
MVVDDDAVGRIMSEVDDWGDYEDIRDRLQNRFPEWGKGRLDGFEQSIKQKVTQDARVTWKQDIIDRRTGFAGRTDHRMTMITDDHGRYLGKEDDIKFYSKAGDGLWGVNTKTGRRAKLG